MRSRPIFGGRCALSVACAALAMPAAFAQSAVANLIEQGTAEDARLETARALETFLQAEKLAPDDANILWRISREYALSMDDAPAKRDQQIRGEQALAYAQRAVAADPRNAKAQLSAAICYGRLAPLVDARTRVAYSRLIKQYADTAVALDPADSYGYHVLGVWNYELAKLNPLLRALARAVYGTVPAASFEAAEQYLLKAVELAPARISHRVELGRIYAALGDKVRARAQLKLALGFPDREKDDPNSKRRAREALQDLN
jgi:tetratricopeptide (TPR) repeat protein